MNTTEYTEFKYARGENSSWSSRPFDTFADVYYILRAGVVPVACLGLLGNAVSLLVWMAATRYNATILLLKLLCVWDALVLLILITNITLEATDSLRLALIFAMDLSQLMSAHLTLIIIVTRLLAVTRPLHVRDILTRRLVHVIHVGTMVWCAVLESLDMIWMVNMNLSLSVKWAFLVFKQTVGLILPLTAMLVVNVCLVVFVHRLRATTRSSLQRRPSKPSDRRLILAVICMSACTLIAYTVGIPVQLVILAAKIGFIHTDFSCNQRCVYIALSVFLLLQTLNSSVNIIFYTAFSTRFRHLLVSRTQLIRGLGLSLSTSSSHSPGRRTDVTGV